MSFRRLAVALLAPCMGMVPLPATADHGGEELGSVSFAIGCRPELQPAFERAVALLHSFGYETAREGFERVAADDSSCAMAQWGIAMTHLHPLWAAPNPAELKAGKAAIDRAAELAAADRVTERERGFIAAMGRFWQEATIADHRTRANRYRDAMAELARRFPEDPEPAIFHALAILGTAPPNDPAHVQQKQAAEILAAWLVRLPNHPGITHYSIHAFDSPELAYLGLDAARRYARIAPAAPHALHMPSHIFIRLGLWPESAASNLSSAASARDESGRTGSGRTSKDELHALDYLEFAYLQTGEDDRARAVAEQVSRTTGVDEAAIGATYALVAVPARFALERRQWAEAARLTLPAIAGVDWTANPQMAAITFYAQAVGAAKLRDLEGAEAALSRLTAQQKRLAEAPPPGPYDWAANVESLRLAAAGCLEHARGRDAEALRLLGQSADLDDKTGKHPVTPGTVLPPRELLAELLLDLGRPGDALREFEASLAVAPNRLQALAGAARAADRFGDARRARSYNHLLAALASPASTRSEVVAARSGLAY